MIFLNGEFLAEDDARVSASDAGLLHAVGLFETFLGGVREGEVWAFDADAHVARLVGSARALGLSDSLRAGGLRDAVLRTLIRSGHARARVRLTITGGDLNLLQHGPERARHAPAIIISARPAAEHPAELFERGVSCVIADFKANPLDPLAGHKTLSYWSRLRELQQAAGKGASEALVFQVSNHLSGGCVSNSFLVRSGRLLTPIARGEEPPGAIPSPVLPGVSRARIIEAAIERGLEVDRRMLTITDVLEADEVFLTNSTWGVLPIVRVERHVVGSGAPGDITRALRASWLDALLHAEDEPRRR